MYNCIYSGHCFEYLTCDKSCPTLAQTSYLLERNNLSMNNSVFKKSPKDIIKYNEILDKSEGKLKVLVEKQNTVESADMLTYCAICRNWKGSRLHCTVYNLKFSQYLESLQKSWSSNNSEELEYVKIWTSTAKVLIISNIDFVNFKDFQCQTLLTLLQSRASQDFTTIIVSPPIDSLVGDGMFFSRLTNMMNREKVM